MLALAICAYNLGICHGSFMTAATIERLPADSPPESLYARMGLLLGLKSAVRSEVDLMDRLEKGLTVAAVQSLRTRAGLTDVSVWLRHLDDCALLEATLLEGGK
jgi:hypothetical protein